MNRILTGQIFSLIQIILILLCGIVRSQNNSSKLPHQTNKTLKAYLDKGINLHKAYKIDSLIILTQKAFPLAIKEKDTLSIAKIYYFLAASYSWKTDFIKATDLIAKSIELFKKKGNNEGMAYSLYLQNVIISVSRPPEEGIKEALRNIKWFKAHSQSQPLSNTYLLLIDIFDNLKNQERKDHFIKEFLDETRTSKSLEDQYLRNNFIANSYALQGDYDAEWPYLKMSLDIIPAIDIKYWQVDLLVRAAQNLRKRNMPEKAKPYLWEAKRLCDSTHSTEGLCLTYRELSLNQLTLNNDQKSLEWMKKAILMARSSRTKDLILPTLMDLVIVQKETGQFENAIKTYQEINERKDSLFTQERSKIIANASAQFDLEKKENRIKLLNKDARLQRVLAEARKLELVKNEQKLYYSLIAVLFLFALLLLIGYFYYKSKKLQVQLSVQKSSLQIQARKLEESNGLKDRMFSIISHDLRNPVASLKAGLVLLNTTKQDQKDVTKFEEQVDFLQYTLDNILYWSLNQQKAISVMQQLIVVDEIVEEVTESLSGLILIKHINLSIINSGVTLLADEQLLIIVLRNIVHNAIKFTPEYESIEISSHSDHAGTQIRIQDSGPGIEGTQQLISSKRTKGTGLGVNLSKELMQRNQGELEIKSSPDHGTLVTLKWSATSETSNIANKQASA